MLFKRCGKGPRIASTATVAASAIIVGDVTVRDGCFIDHGVVIESSGPPIVLSHDVAVIAATVVRSVGGESRPAFPVAIGARTLIGPHCSLVGCTIGRRCYVATGVMVFHGALVGDGTRLGAGSIVHIGTVLPEQSRVGLRHVAVPSAGGALVTSDLDVARTEIAEADFFGTVFDEARDGQAQLHDDSMEKLLREVRRWRDEPLG